MTGIVPIVPGNPALNIAMAGKQAWWAPFALRYGATAAWSHKYELTWNASQTFSRSSTAYMLNSAGVYVPFSTNEFRRFDGYGALAPEPERENNVPYSDLDTSNWEVSGSSELSSLSGEFLGLFEGVRIGSGGSSSDRASLETGQLDAGTYALSVLAKSGSSGKIRWEYTNNSFSTNAIFGGDFSSPGSIFFNGNASFVSAARTLVADGIYLFQGVFTLGATEAAGLAGVGPFSGVADEYIDVYFMQVEIGSTVTSPIVTAGATATRAADDLTLTPDTAGNYDFTTVFSDGSTETESGVTDELDMPTTYGDKVMEFTYAVPA